MWLLRQGHVTAHTPLFVTALVTTLIKTGWVVGHLLGLTLFLGSHNCENTKNQVEAFWGEVLRFWVGPKLRKATALLQQQWTVGARGSPLKDRSDQRKRRMVLLLAQDWWGVGRGGRWSGGKKHKI